MMNHYPWEKKKEDSIKLLKDAIETKINELTDMCRRVRKKLLDLCAIFEPFYANKNMGSGLDLWIAYDIVKRHDDRIKVGNRKDGKGTCFDLSLPRGA